MEKKELDEILAMEKRLKDAIRQVVEDIRLAIGEKTLPGVTQLGRNCCSVKLSAIKASKSMVLAPSYYSQDTQAKAVGAALSRCDSAEKVVDTVNRILAEQTVLYEKEKVLLNPTTLGVLKDCVFAGG